MGDNQSNYMLLDGVVGYLGYMTNYRSKIKSSKEVRKTRGIHVRLIPRYITPVVDLNDVTENV